MSKAVPVDGSIWKAVTAMTSSVQRMAKNMPAFQEYIRDIESDTFQYLGRLKNR